MKYDLEMISKYIWMALMAVMIIAIVIIIVVPSLETRSRCTGTQYFVFLSQKMTPDNYSVELLNGPRDVHISLLVLNDLDSPQSVDVSAGDSIILNFGKDPTDKQAGDTFSYSLTVKYDIKSGILDNSDSGTCTGKVQ